MLRVEEAVIKSAREWYLFVKKKVFNPRLVSIESRWCHQAKKMKQKK